MKLDNFFFYEISLTHIKNKQIKMNYDTGAIEQPPPPIFSGGGGGQGEKALYNTNHFQTLFDIYSYTNGNTKFYC